MKIFNNTRLLTLTFAFALLIAGFGYVKAFTVPVSLHSASPVALVDEDGLSISSSNPMATAPVAPTVTTITDGRKAVTTAGTAVAIEPTTVPFTTCTIQAEENNTGDIVIGGSGVIADLATREGILLTPSASKHYAVPNDLALIFIDSEVNGDGVTFSCQS